MSAERAAETANRLYKALADGDKDGLAALLHPDFVGHAAEGLPLDMGGEHVGGEAMRTNLWWRIGEHYRARAEAEDFQLLPDGRLMVRGHYRGSGRRSGNPLDAEFIHLISFSDDGRLVALQQLTDTAAWHAALNGPSALETIDYRVDDGVATVCLNRPDERNAIDMRVGQETLEVARRIHADPTVRCVLICGNGPALTVGGDIKHFVEGGQTERFGDHIFDMTLPFHQAFDILSRIPAPIVTAAHGAIAGGGLGYVYAADIVIAAEGAKFLTAFAGIGMSGDGGGTWHLPRLIGPRRAAEAYLRNKPIDAQQALEWGMINEIVPADQLREHAVGVARELAAGPTQAFGAMRALLRDSWRNSLSDHLKAESHAIKIAADTRDAAAAINAFVAKQKPTFIGR